MINTIKKVLSSRTFWTVVALVVYNTIQAMTPCMPTEYVPVVDTVLGLMVTYFHINPSQKY